MQISQKKSKVEAFNSIARNKKERTNGKIQTDPPIDTLLDLVQQVP